MTRVDRHYSKVSLVCVKYSYLPFSYNQLGVCRSLTLVNSKHFTSKDYRTKCPISSKNPHFLICNVHRPSYQLLQRQPKTWLTVALSNLMSASGRHIGLCEAVSPTLKVHLEEESLTRHNQQVLIGGVYRLDWAQVSPMRHQPRPELSGELAKWEGNTIKCQGQLNFKCIRSGSPVVSLFAAKRF